MRNSREVAFLKGATGSCRWGSTELPCSLFRILWYPPVKPGRSEMVEESHDSLRIGTASFTTNYTNGTNVTNNNTMLLVLRIESNGKS